MSAPSITSRRAAVFGTNWYWIFFAQLASVVGTWAVVKTVSNFASVSEFGRFGIILAIAYAMNTLLFGPIAAWAQRYYQEAREAGAFHAYYRALALSLGAGVLLGGVLPFFVIVSISSLRTRLDLGIDSVAAAILLGMSISFSDTAVAIANAAFQRRAASVFLIGNTWVRVIAAGIAYELGARHAAAFAFAMVIGIAAIIPLQVVTLARAHRSSGGEATLTILSSIREFTLPLIVWGIPGYVLSFGDRLLLAYYAGPAVVGIYVAMLSPTWNVGNAVIGAANRVLEPSIYAHSGDATDPSRTKRAHDIIRITTLAGAIASVPLVAVYAIWPNAIISFFASGKYATQSRYLWLMFVSTVVFLVGQQLMVHGLVLKRPWSYVPIKFVHAFILATLLAVLIPSRGISGVVYALLVAHSAQLVMVMAVNRFKFGVHLAGFRRSAS